MNPDLTKGYIRELDGLRGIAILLVLVHHFGPATHSLWLERTLHLGWIGVDLFFAISSFLIAGILLNTKGEQRYFSNFYSRRAIRIFPLYYLLLLVFFTLIPLAQGGPYFETEFLRQSGSPLWYVFYLGNLREAMTGVEPAYFLAPTWSLCIEEHFYLAFPLAVALLSTAGLKRMLWILAVTAPLIRWGFLITFPENERIQYLGTICRLDVLALGCLLALWIRSADLLPYRRQLAVAAALLLTILAGAFVAGGLDRTQPFCRVWGYSLVGLTAACLVLTVVLHRNQPATAWLRSTWLCSLGKICYGIYLLQRPSEIALLKSLKLLGIETPAEALWLSGLKCIVAIAVAGVSWHFLERPLLRFKDYFLSARHPMPVSTDAEPVVQIDLPLRLERAD